MNTEPQEAELLPVVHQPQQQAVSLFGTTEPALVIEKAAAVASALRDVIRKQGLCSTISGKEYPRCEAWTLLGTMLGVFPVLAWTKDLPNGYEARVEARMKDGTIVGAAEAICTRDERNWKDRDDFALKSMAQTRATAKALRMPLGFVMTLGGFEATPAEEMAFEAAKRPQERFIKATPVSGIKTPPKATPATNKPVLEATEEQRQKFISLLQPVKDGALAYAIDKAWVLPNEGLEDIPLSKVPVTQKQFQLIMDDIRRYVDGGDQLEGAEASSEPLPDTRPKVQGVIDHVTEKQGQSKHGPWKLYGIKVGEGWYNTFNRDVGQQAQELQGKEVILYYKEGPKGNDAEAIMEL